MRYLQSVKQENEVKLDLKDKKILRLFSSDCRLSLTQIAKQVSLSRDAVNYRITNYEKKGIIQGYRTVVDLSKLGYSNYHIFLKLSNPSSEIEKKIQLRLCKINNIRALIKFSGNFDYEIALVVKNLTELDTIITKIIQACSGFLHDYEIIAITKTYVTETFPPDFIPKQAKESRPFKESKIDKKDIEILKIIGENSSIPLYEIANKLNISADSVAYRINNMKKSGIILKFIPIINYVSLGYNLYTILLNINEFNEEKEKILINFFDNDKNTLWAVKTIGRFNILVYILAKNINQFQESMLKLRSLFPKQINHYETLIAYEEYKYLYFPKELF